MARGRKAPAQPLTTAQQLGSLIKSARDIMRKDKGLSTDIDRLPMLTWIMFLKFLDDREQIEEANAALRGERYRPAIERPYRWRDWAGFEAGMTGPELIAFINQDEAPGPDGRRGPGLFAYLRSLQGGDGAARRRAVIAKVFSGVINRMTSGYLLRDVLNKVNAIHFNSREELYTLGHFYETMLREMRDAAGENGEFYTPRPVVRFMVEMVNPRLGELVLDPACGTGGFLVEAYRHLEAQCQVVGDRFILQNNALLGGEPKPLPYLLCQMNLLLHGLEAPEISADNSLAIKITELGDKDRVDVSRAESVESMVEACTYAFGRIDVLVNNVGIAVTGGAVETTEAEWDRAHNVNLKSVWLVCRQVLPIMEAQGKGAIVNIASIAAHRWTGINYVSYYATKGGVVALSRAIALEYAAKGIRCNSVSPGLMNTPMVHAGLTAAYGKAGDVEHLIRIRDAQCPMGHMGDAWDTAHACLFLGSDEARYVTAHDLVVDGGITAKFA